MTEHRHKCLFCKSAWVCIHNCGKMEKTVCFSCAMPSKVAAREAKKKEKILRERESGVTPSMFSFDRAVEKFYKSVQSTGEWLQ